MANVQLQQALAQMRTLAAEARGGQGPEAARDTAPGDFRAMLGQALGTVNELRGESRAQVDAFLRGDDVSLTDVMVATQKSRVAFEATTQVRNRLLEAYQEISRMQV